jgi:hypothetical protein
MQKRDILNIELRLKRNIVPRIESCHTNSQGMGNLVLPFDFR